MYTALLVLFWNLWTEIGLGSAGFNTGRKWDVARMYLCCCSRYENHWISAASGALLRRRTQRGKRQCGRPSMCWFSVVENSEHYRGCWAGFIWIGPFPWRLLNLTPKQFVEFVCGAAFSAYVITVCESIQSHHLLFYLISFLDKDFVRFSSL